MEIKEVLQTKGARFNFLKGLIRLAKADGIVDESEFAFYQQAAAALDLSEQEIADLEKQSKSEKKIPVRFEADREKMFFLVQAVQLCWVDHNYSDTEQKELRDICREISISAEALKAVEAWVYEGIEWNKRGEALLDLH